MAFLQEMARVVELPLPQPRQRGLFMDVIPRVEPERIAMGMNVRQDPIISTPAIEVFDCDTPQDRSANAANFDYAVTSAWTFWEAMQCSALDYGNIDDLVRWRMRAMLSAALAFVATDAVLAGVMRLAVDSFDAGAGAGVADALDRVEGALADRYANLQAYILVPVSQLAQALLEDRVEVVGDQLQTPSGHVVVADAGQPDGTVYGVGQIGWTATHTDAEGVFNAVIAGAHPNASLTFDDTVRFLSEAYGLIAFNANTAVRSAIGAG